MLPAICHRFQSQFGVSLVHFYDSNFCQCLQSDVLGLRFDGCLQSLQEILFCFGFCSRGARHNTQINQRIRHERDIAGFSELGNTLPKQGFRALGLSQLMADQTKPLKGIGNTRPMLERFADLEALIRPSSGFLILTQVAGGSAKGKQAMLRRKRVTQEIAAYCKSFAG